MKARVWNDNPHTDWKEKFKGDDVFIKKGTYIEMEFYEAHEFKGQYSPIKIKGDGTQDPASFKMVRVESIPQEAGEVEVDEVFPCNLCKKNFATEGNLIKHSEVEHADRMVTDPDAEQSAPKKRGRPPKVASATT